MHQFLEKIFNLPLTLAVHETQELSGTLFNYWSFTNSLNLKVEIWQSLTGFKFTKVITTYEGQEFIDDYEVESVQVSHFISYLNSLPQLSASQMEVLMDFFEFLSQQIMNDYQELLSQTKIQEFILRKKISGNLKKYLKIKALLFRYKHQGIVKLSTLLSPNLMEIIMNFQHEI